MTQGKSFALSWSIDLLKIEALNPNLFILKNFIDIVNLPPGDVKAYVEDARATRKSFSELT